MTPTIHYPTQPHGKPSGNIRTCAVCRSPFVIRKGKEETICAACRKAGAK